MQTVSQSTYRPLDPEPEDNENSLNVPGLSTYKPLDPEPESTSLSTTDSSLGTYRPLDPEPGEEVIDVESKEVPKQEGLTAGQTVASLGIDVGGSVATQAVGYSLAPATGGASLIIPFVGGMASSLVAQTVAEGRDFGDISWGRVIAGGFINLIPGSAATKVARPVIREATKGALIGAADITTQKMIDEKRMPTLQEYALSGALGGAFGTAGGAITKKMNEAKGLVYGMNYSDIDLLLLTKKGVPLREALAEQDIGWNESVIEEQTERLFERIAVQKKKNKDLKITEGWIGTGGLIDSFLPQAVLNQKDRTLRMKSFQFDQKIKTLQSFQKSLPKDISEALEGIRTKQSAKAMNEFGADIKTYLDGGEMSQKLDSQSWSSSLKKFRDMEDEFYKDLVTVLGSENKYDSMYGKLSQNEREFFKSKINRALNGDKYRARQYKALIPGSKVQGTGEKFVLKNAEELGAMKTDTGQNYYKAMYDEIEAFQRKENPLVVTKEQKAARKESGEDVSNLITEEQLVGKDGKSGLIKTHIDKLIKRSGRTGTTAMLKNTLPGNVELVLKNHIPGKLESKWLGEVTDVAFRMKQGNLQLGQQLAKFKSNKEFAQSLAKNNLLSTRPQGDLQEKIKNFGELEGDFYTTPSISNALDQVFGNRFLIRRCV